MNPNDEQNYDELHNKSLHELAQEEEQAVIAAETAPQTPEPTTTTAPEPTEEEKAKQAEDGRLKAEEAQKAHDAEIARVAAEQALAKQKEEERKLLEERAKEEERKRREASLRPAWHNDPDRPKDANGNPLPKTYDEIVEEAARIGEERAYERIKAEEAERQRQLQEQQQGEEAKKAEIERINKEREAFLDKQIESDLNDLYTGEKLTRITDPNNPNDPGVLERNELFKTAAIVNQERLKNGQPPIASLKLIYYEHFKKPTTPAGTQAPVAGNTPPTTSQVPDDTYDYARDHGKTSYQLLAEEKARLARSTRG